MLNQSIPVSKHYQESLDSTPVSKHYQESLDSTPVSKHYQCSDYMIHQPDINTTTRTILVDWLFTIADDFDFPVIYVHKAVKYFDILLENKKIAKTELYLYGCAALSLVDKYFSKYPITINQWQSLLSDEVTRSQFYDAQFELFHTLKFNVLQITYFDIIQQLVQPNESQKKVIDFIAHYMLHYYQVCTENDEQLAKFIVSIVRRTAGQSKFYEFFERIFERNKSKIQFIFKNPGIEIKLLSELRYKQNETQSSWIFKSSARYEYPSLPTDLKQIDLVDSNDFILKNKLGEGAFGVVQHGTLSPTSKAKFKSSEFAIKKFNQDDPYDIDKEIIREIFTLTQLKHSNIIECYHVFQVKNQICAVIELGELSLHDCIETKVFNTDKNTLIKDIITGLHYMHSCGFIHRDVKPSNIIIVGGIAKLADFGHTIHDCVYQERKASSYEICTLWYRSPELLLDDVANHSSLDVWSLGCVIVEIVTGVPLFGGDDELDQLQKIFKLLGTPDNSNWENIKSYKLCKSTTPKYDNEGQLQKLLADKLPSHQIELVVRMFEYNPKQRITMNEVIRCW